MRETPNIGALLIRTGLWGTLTITNYSDPYIITVITRNPKLSTANPQFLETNQGIDSAKPVSQDSAPLPPQK